MLTTSSIPFLCSRCILPDTFPGISFNEEGICNICRREEPVLADQAVRKAEFRDRLDRLIRDNPKGDTEYDFIAAYSGGKDSSYTLKLLKERYGARILALTFDNHFVSPGAWSNIRKVTDRLGIDHLAFRPNWPVMQSLFRLTAAQDIFPKPTLLRASSTCTACIGLVKSLTLKTALEHSIPFVAFGWSPGQAPLQSGIMKTNPGFIRKNQRAFLKALPEEIARGLAVCFIPEPYFDRYSESFPTNIHPLAFFDYDEETIKAEIGALGWEAPDNTDTNSTNCLLNALANECHLNRHCFHPYVQEIANMVRQGIMDRREGIEKIYGEQDPRQVAYAREKLEL